MPWGWLKRGEDSRMNYVDGAGIGLSTSTARNTMMYPGSRLSGEITPLLLLVCSISMRSRTTITAPGVVSEEGETGRGHGALLLLCSYSVSPGHYSNLAR